MKKSGRSTAVALFSSIFHQVRAILTISALLMLAFGSVGQAVDKAPVKMRSTRYQHHEKMLGILFGGGIGYLNLNSNDMKDIDQAGLGKIRQGAPTVHGDVGFYLNAPILFSQFYWSFATSGDHTWEDCFGSSVDVRLTSHITSWEWKFGLKVTDIKSGQTAFIPYVLWGRTLRMSLKDENKDGFTDGLQKNYFGYGFDIVRIYGGGGLGMGLKYIARSDHAYQSFKVGDAASVVTHAEPYSITFTMTFFVGVI